LSNLPYKCSDPAHICQHQPHDGLGKIHRMIFN
jgi:hypothetical protein